MTMFQRGPCARPKSLTVYSLAVNVSYRIRGPFRPARFGFIATRRTRSAASLLGCPEASSDVCEALR